MKEMLPVLAGGVVGFGAGIGGDYLKFKYPQVVPAGGTASVWKDKSLWVNAGVGLVGLGIGAFGKQMGIKNDDVILGSSVAGTVALVKALGIVIKSYQTAGSDWVNYARKAQAHPAYRSTMNKQTLDGPVLGLYNIK